MEYDLKETETYEKYPFVLEKIYEEVAVSIGIIIYDQ
jgi:hypothetical protein